MLTSRIDQVYLATGATDLRKSIDGLAILVFVSPSLMAYTMHRKYSEAIPLYRQEKEYQNFGINLSHQNLANWIIYGANTWLKHLYNRMHGYLLKEPILHADETTMQVLNEEGAQASAITYSIIETAKANNLNPFYYLTYLFEKLPNIDLDDMEELDQLLPWSESIPENCKIPNKE